MLLIRSVSALNGCKTVIDSVYAKFIAASPFAAAVTGCSCCCLWMQIVSASNWQCFSAFPTVFVQHIFCFLLLLATCSEWHFVLMKWNLISCFISFLRLQLSRVWYFVVSVNVRVCSCQFMCVCVWKCGFVQQDVKSHFASLFYASAYRPSFLFVSASSTKRKCRLVSFIRATSEMITNNKNITKEMCSLITCDSAFGYPFLCVGVRHSLRAFGLPWIDSISSEC